MEKRILRLGYLSELEIPLVIRRPEWFHWHLKGYWVIHGIAMHPFGGITSHPSEATEELVAGAGKGEKSIRVFKTPTDAIISLEKSLGQCSLIDLKISLELCTWDRILRLAKKCNVRRIRIGREIINLGEKNK